MHHIVSDGWSVGVLMAELAALYGAFSRTQASSLPPLPLQFADFAAWQRRLLSEEGGLGDELAYWTARLADAPPVMDLPTDQPRPVVPSHRGASHPFEVPAEVGRALLALGRAGGTTPFTTMLAAFAVLLQRWTGRNDVVVGTPVAGRDRPELESLIGFFVNTVPLRMDLSGDPSFDEVVARVRETTLEAFEHGALPLERLVAELDPLRDLTRSPVVQVLFQMVVPQRLLPDRLGDLDVTDLGGLTGASYGEAGGWGPAAPFDLDLFMAPAPDGAFSGANLFALRSERSHAGWRSSRRAPVPAGRRHGSRCRC